MKRVCKHFFQEWFATGSQQQLFQIVAELQFITPILNIKFLFFIGISQKYSDGSKCLLLKSELKTTVIQTSVVHAQEMSAIH